MALSLAAVLLLVGAGAKALRRWPGLRGRGTAAGPLEVVGRVSLGAKEAVCLVRAGSQVVVVGVSPAGVSLLCRLDGTASGEASPATEAGGGSRGPVPTTAPGTRWRELAGRLRDVHAAWGGHAAGVEGRR
jgi:flagellar biogenesis protein FliO